MFANKSSSHMFSVLFAVISLLALTFGAVGVTPAYATTGASLIVNTATDENASNSNCSLREAIIAANTNANYNGCTGTGTYGADTITFVASLNGTPITLIGSQLPAVTTVITITGNGAANTIVQANAAPKIATYRVFQVNASGNLTLDGLTVKNGQCNGSCATATGSGGGIYNVGTLTVTNSTFSGNSATNGGGVFNSSGGTLMVMNSTFSGNSATSRGGGISNLSGGTTLTNGTFINNSANYGGGMSNASNSGLGTTLTNVTFSGNSSSQGSSRGLFNTGSSKLYIRNSIFWDSIVTTSEPQIENNSATLIELYDSVIQDGCPTRSICSNVITDDPLLGALGNYGGFTQTIPLLPSSAAIDAGDSAVCVATPVTGWISAA